MAKFKSEKGKWVPVDAGAMLADLKRKQQNNEITQEQYQAAVSKHKADSANAAKAEKAEQDRKREEKNKKIEIEYCQKSLGDIEANKKKMTKEQYDVAVKHFKDQIDSLSGVKKPVAQVSKK